jgi:hypothetical protein
MQTQSEPARIPTCRGSFLRVKESTHARYGVADRICVCLFGDCPRPTDQSVVTAACLGTRPSAGVALGIWAIREKAHRGLVHPRRDAIGRRPDLPITNDGPVERRLLGPAAVADRCSDAARWRLILDAARNFGVVKGPAARLPRQAESSGLRQRPTGLRSADTMGRRPLGNEPTAINRHANRCGGGAMMDF